MISWNCDKESICRRPRYGSVADAHFAYVSRPLRAEGRNSLSKDQWDAYPIDSSCANSSIQRARNVNKNRPLMTTAHGLRTENHGLFTLFDFRQYLLRLGVVGVAGDNFGDLVFGLLLVAFG